MRENTTKAKLNNGGTVVGCFLRYAEPSLAEFVALQGWDFWSSMLSTDLWKQETWRNCAGPQISTMSRRSPGSPPTSSTSS